jgi:hypothetical protein
MVKVKISYDMREGMEQECQEYLVNRMAPVLSDLGFVVTDVWYTIWGSSPQILGGGELETMDEARRVFGSDEWTEVSEKLESMTENFQLRFLQIKD